MLVVLTSHSIRVLAKRSIDKTNVYLVTYNDAASRIKCEKNGIIEFHIYFIRNAKLNERLGIGN